MKFDFLIVGAGLAGSVLAERIANKLNKTVLIIDRRDHIAGNCFDFKNEKNILIHKFGPHIFHTNSEKVWEYINRFSEWINYEHEVLAVVNNKLLPVPFNLNSLRLIYSDSEADKLESILLEKYDYNSKIPILKFIKSDNQDLKNLAEFIYNNIFLGYNLKQWNLKPEELDSSVTSRVPIYISHDNRYFQDKYQAMPASGYSAFIENILNHKLIKIELNNEFNKIKEKIKFDNLIFTGAADFFFDYKFGKLPYRSLNFQLENLNKEYFQEKAQINYPNDFDFTRITEFKHFYKNNYKELYSTTIAKEYSQEYEPELNEPYYPIPNTENNKLYDLYLQEINKIQDRVLFIGRLAEYKYYNMDQTISCSLSAFERRFQ